MKTALVSIIRNEASDLLAWIGWHALLGVDTFVLFDDGSDDGTRDILNAAATQHDIRVFHIDDHRGMSWKIQEPIYRERQRIIYLDAIHALKDNVNWVGFLDTDEYLTLHRHNTLKNFLRGFDEDVGAVGIHWCLYGSNGYVTRPDMPPFYAYTRHSSLNEPINRHIKTFLRPQCWNGEWENTHVFPLHKGRYVGPHGQDLIWGTVPGTTETLPNWDIARIMHFRVRSLEHFVERSRRRHDTHLTLAQFNEDNYNDHQDSRHQGRAIAVLDWMRSVIFQGVAHALDTLPITENTLKRLSITKPQAPFTLSISKLVPWNDTKLEIHGSYICSQSLAKNSTSLFILKNNNDPHQGFIFALDAKGNIIDFLILSDSRLTSCLRYALLPTEISQRVALRKTGGLSRRYTYLTTVPGEPLIADRPTVHLWETFRLISVDKAPNGREWNELPFIRFLENAVRRPMTLSTIAQLARTDRLITIRFLPLLYSALSSPEQKYLSAQLGPFAPFVL